MGGKLAKAYGQGLRPEEPVYEGHPRAPDSELGREEIPPVEELLAALLGDDAVRDDDSKVLQLLDSSNPNLTLDKSGLKPIHLAVIQKNAPLLQQLLAKRDIDVNARSAGLTALHFAAQSLALDLLQLILNHPAVLVNALTEREKQTASMVAIATDISATDEEKAAIVQCLVDDERCELDKTDGDGWIALTYAARHGNLAVGKVLLSDQRSMLYTVSQLINSYRQAILGEHHDFCDLLMESLTGSQKELIRSQVIKLKALEGTTPFLRDLIHQAGNLLDSDYASEAPQHSSPAWDRNDQLLQPGSVVQLLKNKSEIRSLQKNNNEAWIDGLDNVIGQCGLVKEIDLHGVLTVDFTYFGSPHKKLRRVNSGAVDRLSQDDYNGVDMDDLLLLPGDTVRLTNDPVELQRLGICYQPLNTIVNSSSGNKKLEIEGSPVNISVHAGQIGSMKYHNQLCQPVVIVAGNVMTVDAAALKKVILVLGMDGLKIEIGDPVEISPSTAVLERLQTPQYGGWDPAVLNHLGKTGSVTRIGCECFVPEVTPDCTVVVKVGKVELVLNPRAVKLCHAVKRNVPQAPALKNEKPLNRSPKPSSRVYVPAAKRVEVAVKAPVPVAFFEEKIEPIADVSETLKPLLPVEIQEDLIPMLEKKENILYFRNDGQVLPGIEQGRTFTNETAVPLPTESRLTTLKRSKRFIPFNELKFKQEDKIGRGGFGTVYQARWHGARCAVKVIKCEDSGVANGQEVYEDAFGEADLHGSVHHPNIVQFLGVSLNDADPLHLNAYIVLKFVDGFNLHQCVFGFKMHFSPEEKINIARQVCSAVLYLHDVANIIHQDIKPPNILIDKQTREALITDFGISKVFHDRPLDVTMAMYTNTVQGSLPYMAPELVVLSKRTSLYRKSTKASDIWSLAASLTELFTGRHLYTTADRPSPDLHTLLNLKVSIELPTAIVHAAQPIKAIFQSSLAKEPALRPKSCKELLVLLEIHEEAYVQSALLLGNDSEV